MGSFSLHYITIAVQDNFCLDLENVSAELLIIWQSFLSPQIKNSFVHTCRKETFKSNVYNTKKTIQPD